MTNDWPKLRPERYVSVKSCCYCRGLFTADAKVEPSPQGLAHVVCVDVAVHKRCRRFGTALTDGKSGHTCIPSEQDMPAEYDNVKLQSVNHPSHYGGDTTYEAIKVIEAWSLGFCLGNAVKYICRAGKKPGAETLDDLRKARWYIDREIARLEAK